MLVVFGKKRAITLDCVVFQTFLVHETSEKCIPDRRRSNLELWNRPGRLSDKDPVEVDFFNA